MSPTTDDRDRYNEQRNLNQDKFDRALQTIAAVIATAALAALAILLCLVLGGVIQW